MDNSNTIFGRQSKTAQPKYFHPDPQPKKEKKPRKKRSDAKGDIKFRLSQADKKALQFDAMDHKMSLTAFASKVVKRELLRDRELDFYEYDNSGSFVHVTLEHDYFEMVQTLHVEWGMPRRKVVHRIIKDYLFRRSGGIKITTFRD